MGRVVISHEERQQRWRMRLEGPRGPSSSGGLPDSHLWRGEDSLWLSNLHLRKVWRLLYSTKPWVISYFDWIKRHNPRSYFLDDQDAPTAARTPMTLWPAAGRACLMVVMPVVFLVPSATCVLWLNWALERQVRCIFMVVFSCKPTATQFLKKNAPLRCRENL